MSHTNDTHPEEYPFQDVQDEGYGFLEGLGGFYIRLAVVVQSGGTYSFLEIADS